MDAEQALNERLRAECPTAGNRVSPAPAPETMAVPLLTYQMLNSPAELSFVAVQAERECMYQVTAWAETYSGLMALVKEAMLAINGWEQTWTGFSVNLAWVDNMRDLQDDTLDPPLVGRALDVVMWIGG